MNTVISSITFDRGVKLSRTTLSIVCICVIVCISFFIRTYYHLPQGDELLYEFLWEPDDPTDLWHPEHRFERIADNFSDILVTQVRHFKEINGRFIVHTLEQLFTTHKLLFALLHSCIFLSLVYLIVKNITNKPFQSIGLWIFSFITLMYCFPICMGFLTSMNLGLNYMWPAFFAMLVITIWKKMQRQTIQSKFIPAVCLISFISGWSNESFSIGLSGGLILFFIFNRRKFNKQVLYIILPVCIGTAIMILSPGNHKRLATNIPEGHLGSSILLKIGESLDAFVSTPMVYLFCFSILLYVLIIGDKKTLKQIFITNQDLLFILICTFIFCTLCNKGEHTYTFTYLLLLLFTGKLIHPYFSTRQNRIFLSIIGSLFLGHQGLLAIENIKLFNWHH